MTCLLKRTYVRQCEYFSQIDQIKVANLLSNCRYILIIAIKEWKLFFYE